MTYQGVALWAEPVNRSARLLWYRNAHLIRLSDRASVECVQSVCDLFSAGHAVMGLCFPCKF